MFYSLILDCAGFSFASRGCYLFSSENMNKRKIPENYGVTSVAVKDCDSNNNQSVREALKKKKTTEHMEISICWGSAGGPFPYFFTIVPKCILSHFKPF